MEQKIVNFQLRDLDDLIFMALDLWKDHTYNEMKKTFEGILENEAEEVLLYRVDDQPVGFIHVSLRRDYVEGSNSSPVGYIEGIYVKQSYRGRKIAKELLRSGEQWAKTKGCTQMGSDIEQDNDVSYEFHKKVGFQEANRLICFIKEI
jgi:aminoglycoside 6'-N-acetyltransferase I